MWLLLEQLLSGQTDDPGVIILGGMGAFLILLTVGAVSGFPVGACLGRRSAEAPARWIFSPVVVGTLVGGGFMAAGMSLSETALLGISSWATCLCAGGGYALGWWVTFTAAGETLPKIVRANPFADGDPHPFGHVSD
jgi:hypothetical protein